LVEYAKPWLTLDEQIDKLESRGVIVGDRDRCRSLLRAVGYYRLTGYLYPFRGTEARTDEDGVETRVILNHYRSGTSIEAAEKLIDFDRALRMLVLDGLERIEVSLRMEVGYTLGEISAFAHRDPSNFVSAFTRAETDEATGEALPSDHDEWLERLQQRSDSSDEAFVAHFRTKYDDLMPIWALTEIMELGHLSKLYRGMSNVLATRIAARYDVPAKKILASWIASLNYVRNVSAHHARLFNRKLVVAPARPKTGQVPLLNHLRDADTAKQVYGVYNALAVAAYLLRAIDPSTTWPDSMKALLVRFPTDTGLTLESLGAPPDWQSRELWSGSEAD